jgi:L-serine/L-threonine ammonia-lyase
VFLKLENTQPSSSFKSRGIGNYMLANLQKHQNAASNSQNIHFYSSSGGNAGLACVTAAVFLKCKASVVVPTSTDQDMITKLREAGGTDIIIHGDSWFYADKYLRETVMETAGETAIYVPPFDHPLIWEGASTMIDEMVDQIDERPDAIVCSVGGGGMFSGIMLGLDRHGWSTGKPVQVLAVETNGADSLAQAVAKKEWITLPAITSVAKTLGALRVAENAFKEALRDHVSTVVVEDSEACSACWHFANDQRYLVEPSCGASLSLIYNGALKKYVKNFGPDSKVVFIVCGGSGISLEKLDAYRKDYGF